MRAIFVFLAMVLCVDASARDFGQWTAQSEETRQWFKNLAQPDSGLSCCGNADAYWADSFDVVDGHYVAIITDDRPDEPLNRKHFDRGTRIVIPDDKIKFGPNDPQKDQANKNPTGHGIVFLSTHGDVYCYVPPGGV